MKRWEAWSFHILTLIVTVSGIVYFWMKYLLKTDDPFSVINHPGQPAMLKTHILAAPLFILAAGIMINSHIVKKLQNKSARTNRLSGLILLFSFALMVASGYLLQAVSTPALTLVLAGIHIGAGILFAGAYFTHQAINFLLVKSRFMQSGKKRLAA